jgi:hypothetical protein
MVKGAAVVAAEAMVVEEAGVVAAAEGDRMVSYRKKVCTVLRQQTFPGPMANLATGSRNAGPRTTKQARPICSRKKRVGLCWLQPASLPPMPTQRH